MSEWGNPVLRKRYHRAVKAPRKRGYRCTEATQGSETSQYLVEEKSIEIPLVVASERGTAQTAMRALRGYGPSPFNGEELQIRA